MSGKGKGVQPPDLSLLQSEAERETVLNAAAGDEFRRLVARADSMGIPPGPAQGWLLALAVLRQHDPEFKPMRRDGRPEKWDAFARITLANLIALTMRERASTKADACDYLASQDTWLSNVEGRPDGRALERQCKAEALAAARKTLEHAESAGMFEGYAAQVRRQRDYLAQSTEQK